MDKLPSGLPFLRPSPARPVVPQAMREPTHALDAEPAHPQADAADGAAALPASALPATDWHAGAVVVATDTPLAHEMAQLQAALAAALQASYREERAYVTPLDDRFQLGPTPYVIATHGRRHNGLYCGVATSVLVTTPGIAAYVANLAPGWTALDLPDGATLTSTNSLLASTYQSTSNVQTCVYRARDEAVGLARPQHHNVLIAHLSHSDITASFNETLSWDVGCFTTLFVAFKLTVNSGSPQINLNLIDAISGLQTNSSSQYTTGFGTAFTNVGQGNAFPYRISLGYTIGGTTPNITFDVWLYGID